MYRRRPSGPLALHLDACYLCPNDAVGSLGILHRGGQILMPQEFLQSSQGAPVGQPLGGERVPRTVDVKALDPGQLRTARAKPPGLPSA